MSLPAALTWLQLLPSGTQFSCANAPAWFRSMLREHAQDRAPAKPGASAPGMSLKPFAAVMWVKSWRDLAGELPKHDAVVAVNCPQVTTSRLIAAGYAYARRYAALPSLEHARWFICLDTGKVAAASFSLYTPSRRSAHVKKAVARMLAKLRVPGWYRDEIVIASRTPPPLEARIAELFPGRAIRLALSSGAPEPAINRKPSASVIDAADGNVLAFVKIAASDVSRKIVEHEAEMLRALAPRQNQSFASPRLLFAGEVDGRYITVQSPLPGEPVRGGDIKDRVLFLQSLMGSTKPATQIHMIAALRDRLASLVPPRSDLVETFDALLPALEQMRFPSTVVHGDFAPWNLRLHNGKLSAFDWEYGEIDGVPMIDELHFRLQHGLELEKWSFDAAAAFMNDYYGVNEESLPWTRQERESVRVVQAIYLLDHLARLYGEGYSRDNDMVHVYEQLLARLEMPKREAALV
jgi:hypothetical protein